MGFFFFIIVLAYRTFSFSRFRQISNIYFTLLPKVYTSLATENRPTVGPFPRILPSFHFRPNDGQQWKPRCRSGLQSVTGRTRWLLRLSAREIEPNGRTIGISQLANLTKWLTDDSLMAFDFETHPLVSTRMSYFEWFPLESPGTAIIVPSPVMNRMKKYINFDFFSHYSVIIAVHKIISLISCNNNVTQKLLFF